MSRLGRFFRFLRAEGRDFPATYALGAAWLAVYLAMAAWQGTFQATGDWFFGSISTATSHVFGDQTPRELAYGQFWRALTATFIHYSLLHLGLNLIGLIQFGRMVEDWYGSGPLLLLYAVIGFLGNLTSGLLKPWLKFNPTTPSGGGSGVVVGLIALIAVAGWMSRSRFGNYVRTVMLILLALTALMGFLFKNLDNLGHAGGALFGALAGLFHPALSREADRRFRIIAGLLGVAAILLCAGLQVRANQREARAVVAVREAGRMVETYTLLMNVHT
ncbi:MAG: rhomboid family intramembrane serine protease, partial [Isosphaeraceae bacterium]|nr:rhomboid family intramembrane serine protease [Isosphaeraceae bacterium]